MGDFIQFLGDQVIRKATDSKFALVTFWILNMGARVQ